MQFRGALGHLDRIFIIAHEEKDFVAFHAAIAGLYIGANFFKSSADVRPAIGIVDRGGQKKAWCIGHHIRP